MKPPEKDPPHEDQGDDASAASPAPEAEEEEDDRTLFMPMPTPTPPSERVAASEPPAQASPTPPEPAPEVSAPPPASPVGPPPVAPSQADHSEASAPPPAEVSAPPASQPPAPPSTAFTPPQTQEPDLDNDPTSIVPLPPPRTTGTLPLNPPAEVGVGTLVNNNYEITQILSSGGMGSVYRGVEIGTGDPVAIKAILPELAEDEKAGLLFKREARTLRQLTDEAIVRYYNYVHDRELNRYFLVMEYIEGVPLSEHIKTEGKLPVQAVITLLKRLSKGLAKAHQKDVIHRDLSPDNVMLDGGNVAQARLIDFGIAKSNVVKEGTMHGQFAGKLKYVAPEQLGHFDGKIGPGTDVYGLALLIIAAAVGKPLDMGANIAAAVQTRQSIPDLSHVPIELRPILTHMLEPDPANRPASMDELRRLLEFPTMIPAKYRDGLPMPPSVEMTSRGTLAPMAPAPTAPPPGLQMPMMTSSPRTLSPTTATAETLPPSAAMAPPEDKETSGNSALGILMVIFLVVLGGVGFVAWQSGMLGDDPAVVEGDPPAPAPPARTGDAPLVNTRAGFLAAFDSGECTYLNRVEAGINAGMVEGFSQSGNEFPGLPVAYEEKFGARPAILPRQVNPSQCATLDFVRALQGRGNEDPALRLSADTVASGQPIRAQLRAPRGQAVWAALVTPAGGVFNLTSRVSDPVGDMRTLDFGLNLAAGAAAVPQLVLVVTSREPLTRTAMAADGSAAAELLPVILEEIKGGSAGATASLGYVLLTPPEVEAVEEEAPSEEAGED